MAEEFSGPGSIPEGTEEEFFRSFAIRKYGFKRIW